MDEVSQLPNHKAAELNLKVALDDFYQTQTPFSLLFIDGDNLKRFNDVSYEYGNNMIRQLGVLLNSSIRKDDMVFRWLSGDEFVILLKNTGKDAAYKLAERIRSCVEYGTLTWDYPVTISIGVSNFPEDGSDLSGIISVAEKSNAKAKKSGKNCVH